MLCLRQLREDLCAPLLHAWFSILINRPSSNNDEDLEDLACCCLSSLRTSFFETPATRESRIEMSNVSTVLPQGAGYGVGESSPVSSA